MDWHHPEHPDPENASQWGGHGWNKSKERAEEEPKGKPNGNGTGADNTESCSASDAGGQASWGEPDRSVLRLNRRPPRPLPLQVFGDGWGRWIADAAAAAACPVDYVAATLLPAASCLVGNARWPQATRLGRSRCTSGAAASATAATVSPQALTR
jgi:hypothetical protein